jgi:hypothetical protein
MCGEPAEKREGFHMSSFRPRALRSRLGLIAALVAVGAARGAGLFAFNSQTLRVEYGY